MFPGNMKQNETVQFRPDAQLRPQAGLSDLPHSRQHVLRRDVINPQNGHILCDPKLAVFMPKIFLNESLAKPSTV
jgi:hypothetical protein